MIDVKQIAKSRQQGGASGGNTTSGYGINSKIADEAKHAAKADIAQYAEQSEYANRAGYASRAAYSDRAYDLTEDSPAYKRFLRKDIDDTAQGTITFNKVQKFMDGLTLGDKSHYMDGKGNAVLRDVALDRIHDPQSTPAERVLIGAQGFDMYIGDDNKAHLYIDYLSVRNKAFFSVLGIRKVSYSGGTLLLSNAGSTIVKVVYIFDEAGENVIAYKCYSKADDGTTATNNWWKVGMMALCQTFNVKAGVYKDVSNRYYWRLCIGAGQETLEDGKLYDWVILSNVKEFGGGDSILPSYVLRVLADESGNYLSWGGVFVAVNNKEASTSLASLYKRQDGIDVDNDNTPISNRTFYGYEEVEGKEPDAPMVGDVIVQAGDQINWNGRGNVVKITTSTEDNGTDNAPSFWMYHGIGKPRTNDDGIVNVWQWKTVTALLSPIKTRLNSEFFTFFTGNDPYEEYDPWAKTLNDANANLEKTKAEIKATTDEISATVSKVKFDKNGNITNINTSGLVTESDYAEMFSKSVDVDGNIRAVASISTKILVSADLKREDYKYLKEEQFNALKDKYSNISQVKIKGNMVDIDADHCLKLSSSQYLIIESGNFKLNNDKIEIYTDNFTINSKGDCSISGEINATSGKIGGFQIQGNGLYNSEVTEDAYINIYNDREKMRAAIGSNTLSPVTGLRSCAFFDSSYPAPKINGVMLPYTNTGMIVMARNSYYNNAIQATGNVIVHNGYTADTRYNKLSLDKSNTTYTDNLEIRLNNVWVVNAVARDVSVGLPMYTEVQKVLGISGNFAILFKIIADYNSGSFSVKGRKNGDANYSGTQYPNIIYHDGQHLDEIGMEMGDSIEFLLVYDSDNGSKESYDCKYTARVINRQFE